MGGNQGDGWKRGKFDFSAQINNNKQFSVIFEASRGPAYTSDIALDDISFSDCIPREYRQVYVWCFHDNMMRMSEDDE